MGLFQETLASVNRVESYKNTFSVRLELGQSIFRRLQLHCITELQAFQMEVLCIAWPRIYQEF